ncbi:hypothetical protein [Rhizobium sp. SG570]|uniref:hypothetical protein n=1 Tax=Rhizobium sp. SG570 TaxID=2587113 RepID=UPI001444F5D7|nr:hypothetical protein [Rhizobium sp. SG570]NKJ37401.1 hypothetical protein [Rhizobium sp. SG570]
MVRDEIPPRTDTIDFPLVIGKRQVNVLPTCMEETIRACPVALVFNATTAIPNDHDNPILFEVLIDFQVNIRKDVGRKQFLVEPKPVGFNASFVPVKVTLNIWLAMV